MVDSKKPNVKSKAEAVLFSVGHKISLDDISRLCRTRKEEVLPALRELQQEYETKQSSLMLVEEGDSWKFTVRDYLIPVVRRIVTETELSKSVMETLAVIAFKYPILQSDLIKIRTNKAYDHLVELEKSGYITRQKHSRTNLIKLTEKFFKYFDLTEEKLKDQFKDFDSIARAIKDKEEEVEKIKEEQRKRAEELKQQDEKIKKEIESLDKVDEQFEIPLNTYEAKPEEDIIKSNVKKVESEVGEKIGNLEVVEVPEQPKQAEKVEQKLPAEEQPIQEKKEIKHKERHIEIPHHKDALKKRVKKGIHLPPEMEKKVDEKVEKLLHGENIENKKEN